MTEMNPELQGLIVELKKTVESKQAESAESQAKISSLEAKMVELEAKLADDSKSEEVKVALEEKLTSLQDNVKNVEKKIYRNNASGAKDMNSEVKDFESFLRTAEVKYLRTDRDPDGGYLVPTEMANTLIEKLVEVSDFRRLARVMQIGGKALEIGRGDTDLSVYFVGEGVAATESAPLYGKLLIPAHKLMAEVRVTNELLADAAYDMVNQLNVRAAIKFAEKEGQAFLTGTGVGEPEGILTAAGTTNVNSGNATQLTADALIDMTAQFKYRNPVFLMNRATFAAARKLKDGTGQYLLQGGLDGNLNMRLGGVAGTILGIPVVLMQGLADVGAAAKPVVLLDPQEAYLIVDRLGMNVLRDNYTLGSEDKVKFLMSRRVGGAVVKPDAIVTLTISV